MKPRNFTPKSLWIAQRPWKQGLFCGASPKNKNSYNALSNVIFIQDTYIGIQDNTPNCRENCSMVVSDASVKAVQGRLRGRPRIRYCGNAMKGVRIDEKAKAVLCQLVRHAHYCNDAGGQLHERVCRGHGRIRKRKPQSQNARAKTIA